jgi:hypothetical protein
VVSLAENRPENGSPGQIGTGVHAESIRRSLRATHWPGWSRCLGMPII